MANGIDFVAEKLDALVGAQLLAAGGERPRVHEAAVAQRLQGQTFVERAGRKPEARSESGDALGVGHLQRVPARRGRSIAPKALASARRQSRAASSATV